MLEKTITSYGAPYEDSQPVENPTTEMAASAGNRVFEDVAQMTRTVMRAFVSFVPTATAAPVDVDVVSHWSIWGSGDTQKPTVTKTGTGIYQIEWPATLTDGLNEDEELALRFYFPSVYSGAGTYRTPPIPTAEGANSVTIKATNLAGTVEDRTDITIRIQAW